MKELKIGENYRYNGCHGQFDVELISLSHPTNDNSCAVRKLSDNNLMWVGKDKLGDIPKDTSHLKGLFEELKVELRKASECKDYYGIVFVHPDDVGSVVRYISNLCNAECNPLRRTFRFEDGGKLMINTLERDNSSHPQYDYAGCGLTTILVHGNCFGKYTKGEYISVNDPSNTNDFILYMMSRNRSQSKFPARFVYVPTR